MSQTLDHYFSHVGDFDLLTAQQEKDLARKMESGDSRARNLMIESNLRLALSIANKYRQTDFPMEDIIQESNVGLIKAVDRFDYKKGFRFSTYACWWIRQSIRRYLAMQGHVKFPAGSRHMIWKINNVRSEYEEEFGVQPNNAEIADLLGIKEHLVENLRRGMQWPVNINAPVGKEGNRTWADIIPDTEAVNLDYQIDQEKIMENIKAAFSSLKPQEELVLRLRFGISENGEDDARFPITEKELKTLNKRTKNRK